MMEMTIVAGGSRESGPRVTNYWAYENSKWGDESNGKIAIVVDCNCPATCYAYPGQKVSGRVG